MSIPREIQQRLVDLHARPRGRLLVLTGARQVGKSTLARMSFPDYPVVNLDSPHERAAWERVPPETWIARVPRAIIDEAQKLPAVFDTIKACYDRDPTVRYVLLGSSQIRLMDRVRESLAGRIALLELFPLSLPEIVHPVGDAGPPPVSPLVEILRADDPAKAIREWFGGPVLPGVRGDRARSAWADFLSWGGMPALHGAGWTLEDREGWLADYQVTYLQRDLADIARLDRLEPFARLQQAAALRTSKPVNYAELGRLAGVAPQTAREYLRYLEVSYQVLLLPSWFRNPEKRLVKQEKLHFLDPGILRSILRRRGTPDGWEVENAVIAEVAKQVRTHRLPVDLAYLRTHDGREVDLLLERGDGFIAIEVKASENVVSSDFRHLRDLEGILDKPLLAGLVISHDAENRQIEGGPTPLWKLEAASLLS